MSKLFVCVGKKASTPYSELGEHFRIYTIEELCYYICGHVDMLDDTFMKESLADFTEEELGLSTLAERLRQIIQRDGTLSEFCKAILDEAEYLGRDDRRRMEAVIAENATLPVRERMKKQGDLFLQQKYYYKAQKVYRNLLQREDVRGDNGFMAEIYDRLGTAAALLFQYETAAYCYDKSCKFFEQEQVRRKYLLCLRFLLSKSQYAEWLSGHEEYYELSEDVEKEYARAKEVADLQMQENSRLRSVGELQEEYCQMVLE